MFFTCLLKQDPDSPPSPSCLLNISGCLQSMPHPCPQETPFSRTANTFFCYPARLQPKTPGLTPSTAASRLELECVKASPVSLTRWERISLLVFSSTWGILKQCCLRPEDVVKQFLRVFFKPSLLSMGRIHDSKETWARLIHEIDPQWQSLYCIFPSLLTFRLSYGVNLVWSGSSSFGVSSFPRSSSVPLTERHLAAPTCQSTKHPR